MSNLSQVSVYKNGQLLCGASLIHSTWLLTHAKCAKLCDPAKEFCVARMGGHHDGPYMSNTEQFRRIASYVQLMGDSKDVFLGKLDSPFTLNDYVNTLCIPSAPWNPIGAKCFMTGWHKEGYLNQGVETYIGKPCDVVSEQNYKVRLC